MKMKMFFFLVIVLVLLPLTVYAGGGSSQAAGSKPEITITILDRVRSMDTGETYENNRWIDWINANSPVRVKFVPVLRTEARETINRRFAAGTAPDLVYEYGKVFMDGLYDQGVIQPLDQHIDRYSTAYKQYLRDNPALMPYLVAEDGKQYGMSSMRGIEDLYVTAWWIRQDWVQKFNVAVPSTLDQFNTYMRRVRDEDPDGNGQRDTFGMAFHVPYIYDTKAIFGAPFQDFLVENGSFVDWTSTPGYRDWLAWWAMMYSEGLVDAEWFTDMQSTRQDQFVTTGRAGSYFGIRPSNGDGLRAKTLRRNVPTAVLVPMDPPATSYGKFSMYKSELANYMVCMNAQSSTTAKAQSIMQYMDWLITDGWMTLTYGELNRHYRLQNGVPITIEPANTDLRAEVTFLGDMAFVNRLNPQPFWFSTNVVASDPLSVEYGRVMDEWFAQRMNDRPRQYVPYAPTSAAIQRFKGETDAAIQQLEIAIIIGRAPLDAGLAQINGLKTQAGWAAVNAEKDAWYQKNRSLFNF
jgi:putative aldouronate transport system substrate-binding protein